MRSNVLTMCAMSTFSTGKAAAYLGVGVKTLQRWDREGRLKPERTPSGRRAYSNAMLQLPQEVERSVGRRCPELILGHTITLGPTPDQECHLRRACGTARYAYNWGLAERQRMHTAGERPSMRAIKLRWNAHHKAELPRITCAHI
jgi:hypothetical protein